ncbi:unnamed protein product [Tilletia laevis]|uniref:Uncharacterized protein n=1 Tax=Tilletia laevis TaxID=157183 RepID=A0A9N8Q8V6_9BASI|nr:unnamed protein product [Tilletia laevis]
MFASPAGPAPLEYPMTKERKRGLYIGVGLLLFVCVVPPCVVYYVLSYAVEGVHRSTVYGYTSISMGVLQPLRSTLLQRTKRTLFRADTLQWLSLLIGIGASIPMLVASRKGAFIPLVLKYPITMGIFGLSIILVTALSSSPGIKQPCRLSSVKAGMPFRPALAYLWEDLTAVEGGGGYSSRQAFSRRYDSSPIFREMNTVVSVFLGISFLLYFALALVLTLGLANYSRGRNLEALNFGANFFLFVVWNAATAGIALRWVQSHAVGEFDGGFEVRHYGSADDWSINSGLERDTSAEAKAVAQLDAESLVDGRSRG